MKSQHIFIYIYDAKIKVKSGILKQQSIAIKLLLDDILTWVHEDDILIKLTGEE